MLQTDTIYNSVSSTSLRHHSSGKQNIDIKDKKTSDSRCDLKNDKKEVRDREQVRKEKENKNFKREISGKDYGEKREHQITGRKETTDSMPARKTGDEKSSKGGEKTEKKLITIGNTFKELRKAIDNLKTQGSSAIVSNKSLSEKNSIHRISLQSDPSVSYPVTREQKILASLVTGDVKPSVREDKKDIKKNNTPEVREEDIKGNTVRGKFIRQGRKEKKYEEKINYFFNPVIPGENSKKKLEEYLKTKYSSSRIKSGEEEKHRPSMLKPDSSSDLKKNDELSKKSLLQSPLSRFLNHHGQASEKPGHEKTKEIPHPVESLKTEFPVNYGILHNEKLHPESLKTESPVNHGILHNEKLQSESLEKEPLRKQPSVITADPVISAPAGPVFIRPTHKLTTRQEKVEFFVASLKSQGVVDIENIGIAGKNSSLSEDEISYFLIWLSAKGKKFVDFNDSKTNTMSDIFVYAAGANGDMAKFIRALEMYATSPYATSGGVGKESFEALAFIAGHPMNWDKLRDKIGKLTGGWSVGGVDFSRDDIKKEIRSWFYKLDEQPANPLVPRVWDKIYEETDRPHEAKGQDNLSIKNEVSFEKDEKSSEKDETSSETSDLEENEKTEKLPGNPAPSQGKISKRERVQNFVDDLVRRGNNLSPVAIQASGRHHGLREEEVNRFITWLSEVDSGNINFNNKKVNMICDVFIAATEANKDMVKFARTVEMSAGTLVG